MGLWHADGSPNLGQKTRPNNNQPKKKKKHCKIVLFAVPADHRIKCENKDKYIDLARELKDKQKKKQTMEHEGDKGTNRDWGVWYSN